MVIDDIPVEDLQILTSIWGLGVLLGLVKIKIPVQVLMSVRVRFLI